MCVERADVRYTLARDGLLDVLLSADNVLVCCWHAAIVLAFLQALWRAPARGQVRWDGDAACLEEAAHLFGFIIRAMLRCLRNTRGACGKAESARNLERAAMRVTRAYRCRGIIRDRRRVHMEPGQDSHREYSG